MEKLRQAVQPDETGGVRFVLSKEEVQTMKEEGITVTAGPSALNQKAGKKPVSQVLADIANI